MAGLSRRWPLLVALIGGVSMASVAAASLLGKPPAIATPVGPPAVPVALHGLDEMIPTDPPKALPAISFQDDEGRRHELTEFLGRPVVLNFWATWCQPCIAELPALAALSHDQDAITVVALSTDRGGAHQVRAFLGTHAIDLPIRLDPMGEAAENLGLRGLPTTLVIDAQGRERGRFEGAADWNSEAARRTVLELTGK